MIRIVLVALDGSPRAPGVFAMAAEVSARFGAVLHPVRSIFVPPEFPAASAGSRMDPLPAHLTLEAMDDLRRFRTQASLAAVGEPIVRVGPPWSVILEVADELDADLIVIGSHGYYGLDRILGTTAAHIVNHARRNVLVVHDRPGIGDRA
jgi:nucleotide-binding universal stress UspA family protein